VVVLLEVVLLVVLVVLVVLVALLLLLLLLSVAVRDLLALVAALTAESACCSGTFLPSSVHELFLLFLVLLLRTGAIWLEVDTAAVFAVALLSGVPFRW